jgi:hypothetical protein
MTLTTFDVLRLPGNASYLKAFEPGRLQAMVGLAPFPLQFLESAYLQSNR